MEKANGNQHLIVKEKTPTSFILKLRLPPQRLQDLLNPIEMSASISMHSSPPPSSPVASTAAVADPVKIPGKDAGSKRKTGSKAKKTKIVIGEDGKPVEIQASNLSSRLGPKSSAGAINENLRNLDRSGKPCRRWHKKHIFIKSLHGYKWRTLSWNGDTN